MDQENVEIYRDGTLAETLVSGRPKSPAELEAEAYRTNLAAEFAAFKTALDALTALPNSSVPREVKDFARASRRMFRAAIRDLQAIDTEVTP